MAFDWVEPCSLFKELANAVPFKCNFGSQSFRDAPVRENGLVFEVPLRSTHGGTVNIIEPAPPQGNHFFCMQVEQSRSVAIVGVCAGRSFHGQQMRPSALNDKMAVQLRSRKTASTTYYGVKDKPNLVVPIGGVVTLLMRSNGPHSCVLSVYSSQSPRTWLDAMGIRNANLECEKCLPAEDGYLRVFVALGHGDQFRIIDPPRPHFWHRSMFSWLSHTDRAVMHTLVTLSILPQSPVASLSPELVDIIFQHYLGIA
eukprot:TRINITY_DN6388_c0_g1_i1.p2 TRINITY_DN6388_c0_g1~~TRINITY_DN6388_c0_g1_i1.p2  ORF type:complete len:256 (+),score=19.26 TRINITY_DN6388_c0_g1_i1:177-944(+)